mgnify:CR=1 FL=1
MSSELSDERCQEILAEIYENLKEKFPIAESENNKLDEKDYAKHYYDLFFYLIEKMKDIKSHDEETMYKLQMYLIILIASLEDLKNNIYGDLTFQFILKDFTIDTFITWLKSLRFN